MGKIIKWLLVTVSVLVGILVIAGLIVANVFDPNDYKERIVALMKEKTGRELRIDKHIGLTLFPRLGVDLSGVTLANAPGFGAQPFARVGDARVSVKLLPLLSRRVEVDTVTVDGLTLNLATDKSGRNNWDDLAGKGAKEMGETQNADGGAAVIESISIGGLDIRKVIVNYVDRRDGASQQLDLQRLHAGEIVPGGDIPVELLIVAKTSQPAIDVILDASATLKLAKSLQRFEFPDLHARVQAKGEGMPSKGVDAELSAALIFDRSRDSFSVKNLLLKRDDLSLSGAIDGSDLSGRQKLSGDFELAPFNLKRLLGELGVALNTRDAKALTRVGLNLKLDKTSALTRLTNLQARLDDSKLSGSASVGSGEHPPVRFELHIDTLDADRYLPPTEATADDKNKARAADTKRPELPLKMLRGLNLDGSLRIAKLKLYGLKLRNAVLGLKAKRGVVRIEPLAAKLYNGSLKVAASMNVQGGQPRFSVDKRLAGVRIGPLLKDMTGDDPRITGTANLAAKLKSHGLDDKVIRRNLNGRAGFSFTDGSVRGYDLAGIIRQAMAALKGKSVKSSGPQKTDFAGLKGSLKISNGVARNDDFLAKSPFLRVKGRGTIDLANETLDYLLTTKLVGSVKGQGGDDLEKLKGLPIPVRVSGAFSNPSIKPDLESILKEVAKRKLLDKVKEKAGGKLGEALKKGTGAGFGDLLKGKGGDGGLGGALQGLFK